MNADVDVDVDEKISSDDESSSTHDNVTYHTNTPPTSILSRLKNAMGRVQEKSFNIVEETKKKSIESLTHARIFLANLIRKDHDSLEVDSAISQLMIDRLTNQVNCLLITSSWLGGVSALYTIVAGVYIVIGDGGNSTVVERSVTIIPPAIIQTLITGVVIFLQQLQIVDRLKELTNVKTDADYVISKLEPMYKLAERAESFEVLENIDKKFLGETSSLKQKAWRAISKVLKKEDRAVHLRKYRYLMLQELHAKAHHEHIRDLLMRHNELNIPLEVLANEVEAFGAYGTTNISNNEIV